MTVEILNSFLSVSNPAIESNINVRYRAWLLDVFRSLPLRAVVGSEAVLWSAACIM